VTTGTSGVPYTEGSGFAPPTAAQAAALASINAAGFDVNWRTLNLELNTFGSESTYYNAYSAALRAGSAPTPTITASINPMGQGGAQISGIFPTEEIVPNVGGFFSSIGASLGESFGGLINDVFQTDQSWDQWGAGFGTIADILAVTGVIPGGAAGHYPPGWQPQPDPHRPLNVPLPPTPIWGGVPPPWTQPQAPAPTQPLQPYGGIPMPHVPTSIPVAFPGGAPVQQAAFPMQITPGGGGGQIRPAAHCSTSLPSRVDIPTVDARGNTRFTTFKNMGRPLLWSGDLAASKRVRKVAAKARRAKGR